jgi:hypothetical protein
VPQFFGCCDQSVEHDALRMALYVIYSSDGTGDKAGEISTLWLKAYGVSAIGVAASGSSQLGQPFAKPKRFEGILKEAWRDGDTVVYRVPRPNEALAHVIDQQAVVTTQPANGIDVEPLKPLVAALDSPKTKATFRWINQHEAEITAEVGAGQIIFVQETFDPGWRARVDAGDMEIRRDALGLMTIDSGPGRHTIRLEYAGDYEDRAAWLAQIGGFTLLLWVVLAQRRASHHPGSIGLTQ